MRDVRVREWMHPGVITCAPTSPVDEVASTMTGHDVSALVVIDADGYAVGVISRTDLVNATFVQPYFRHWKGMVARHLMSAPVVSVRADSSVAEAAALMRERRIHRVVVTALEGARERPVGILSATDLVGRLGRLEALPKEGP